MPFNRPTLTEMQQSAYAAFVARLKGATGALRRNILRVVAIVLAGLTNGLYGYLDYLIRQNFTATADMDYLIVQGAEFGMAPTGATFAAGAVDLTGTDGGIIPDQLVLFQDAAGNQFITQGTAEIAGGVATVPVMAVVAGAAANLDAGTPLQLLYAIANVDAQATVASNDDETGLTGGTDAESPESFSARIMARKQQPPQGGASADYVGWARSVAGVTRAWAYPLNRGGGTTDLTFVMDARDNIIPLGGDVATVQAAIDAVRPVTDDCQVFAATDNAVAFTIQGTFTGDQQTAITNALKDMFSQDAVPGGAYNLVTGGTYSGGLSFQDQIVPAVQAGAGDVAFKVTVPNADIAGAAGTLLTLGAITWAAP